MPGCRRALRWLGSQLLYRRSQGDCPEPMRTSQRNLHHQLLRSGVLIFSQSRDGSSHGLRPYAGVRPAASRKFTKFEPGKSLASLPVIKLRSAM